MSLPRHYVETTVPSYLTARRSGDLQLAADQQTTEHWWNHHRHHYECFVSPVVIDEVSRGDATFAASRLTRLAGLTVLSVNDAAQELTVRLLRDGVIPSIAADDAAHLGVAAAHGMDFLLTWNCKHINNPHLIRRIERACASVAAHVSDHLHAGGIDDSLSHAGKRNPGRHPPHPRNHRA